MVALQCLNKIINNHSFDIVVENALDRTYFSPYQKEFDFISEHFNEYGNVPDKETFLNAFPEFDTFDVLESDDYLIKELNEEHLYSQAVPILERSAELLKDNSVNAVDFLMQNVPQLNKSIGIKTVDIIHNASSRLNAYTKKLNGADDDFYISTGFNELDYAIHGWSRGEELIVLFARTNQGKSWILAKFLSSACMQGFNVGFISPEMSADKIGFRVDTLLHHFDNTALNWGKEVNGYNEYIESLKSRPAKFCVSTPIDFGGCITVNKIRTFIQNNNIEILGIDGLTYVQDERRTKFDSLQAQLTHIAEDLFQLSSELHLPIIGVVQANRDGVKQNHGELELENIRDADGISYNASKVIAIRQKVDEEVLELTVKKNRDGAVGNKLIYQWIPNIGTFNYIPSEDDANDEDNREEAIEDLKDKFKSGRSIVF